jgi:hypothetical protein
MERLRFFKNPVVIGVSYLEECVAVADE